MYRDHDTNKHDHHVGHGPQVQSCKGGPTKQYPKFWDFEKSTNIKHTKPCLVGGKVPEFMTSYFLKTPPILAVWDKFILQSIDCSINVFLRVPKSGPRRCAADRLFQRCRFWIWIFPLLVRARTFPCASRRTVSCPQCRLQPVLSWLIGFRHAWQYSLP